MEGGSHLAQGVTDSLHRAFRQARVAHQGCLDVAACNKSRQQAHCGAAVAAIQLGRGLTPFCRHDFSSSRTTLDGRAKLGQTC